MMKTGISTILILFFFALPSFGQHITYKQYQRVAEEAELEKDYHNAARFYMEMLRFNRPDDKLTNTYKAGLNALRAWEMDTSVHYFKQAMDLIDWEQKKNAYLDISESYQRMARYDSAYYFLHLLDSLNTIESEIGLDFIDASDRERMDRQMKIYRWATNQKPDSSNIIVRPLDHINTPDEHEMASTLWGADSLLYSWLHYNSDCHDQFIHQVGDITLSVEGNTTERFRDDLAGSLVDSTIAFTTFNSDQSRLYYCRCYNINTLDMRCRIVKRDRTGSEGWSEEMAVVGESSDTFTYSHPNIGWDPARSREVLYYSSDRPGPDGNGGMDIWSQPLNDSGLVDGEPSWLEKINTPYNEVSPFFERGKNILYHSSDRRDNGKGYGGFDIYKSEINSPLDTAWNKILRRPYNSSKNDLFYVVRGDTSWFTSNRTHPTDANATEDACCYDLFEAIDECEVTYRPKIYDYCTTSNITSRATVTLIDSTDRSRRATLLSDGSFDVERGEVYWLVAELEGYGRDSLRVEVNRDQWCDTISCDLFLRPEKVKLALDIGYVCDGQRIVAEGAEVYIRLMDPGMSYETTVIIRDAPLEIDVYELKSYSIEVRHPMFQEHSETYYTGFLERDACERSHEITLISWGVTREEISLYFENDVPGPRTRYIDSSMYSYSETWEGLRSGSSTGYGSAEMQAVYRANYDGNDADIDAFFSRIRDQKVRFDSLKMNILSKLQEDRMTRITLKLEGRASPLASEEYNLALSKRRIHSIVRDFREDSRFRDVINRIVFVEDPGAQGESASKSKPEISDDRGNLSDSWYSPEAAEERKITIRIIPESCEPNDNI